LSPYSEKGIKETEQMKKVKSASFIIEGVHYITGKQVSIEISDGLISKISDNKRSASVKRSLFVAPGLIDNQINGYANVDFSGNELTASDVIEATKAIWGSGVTTFLPTLITNSHEILIKNLRVLDEAHGKDNLLRKSVPGFHLEGPFISPEEGFRGCHPVKHIRKPSLNEFKEFQEASGGKIIQVTVAPETEGAMEFIKSCSSSGIIVAIGHTNATALQIKMAVENGASLSTHLGNGCANYIHRHNNPVWQQLSDDRLMPSLIIDGHHLLPEEVNVFYKVKGADNIILTSDVIYLAGMAPGKYSFLGSEVILTPDGLLLNTKLNCLAGASFPLTKGIGNMMNFTGCSLAEAIKMATVNVARIFSLNNRGELAPGKRADLILFEMKDNNMQIKSTYLNGNLVYTHGPRTTRRTPHAVNL
jgi:N-acetylglucosamine-6-phosphate deacetylase